MSLLEKKDMHLLLDAGFDESDLGLTEGGKLGVQFFSSPDSYFAHEVIENACEQGECDLCDDIVPFERNIEPYDTSRKKIWADHEYPGNEDPLEDIEQNLRSQVNFLLGIKVGKMSIWQAREKNGKFKFPVTKITVSIPAEEKERMGTMDRADQKELWIKYAREEWKKCWQSCIDSLWSFPIEETTIFKTAKGKELNMLVISADNIRKVGYKALPPEARWISMVYFIKDR